MTAERESMTLQEMGAPALGVEERRDEAPGAQGKLVHSLGLSLA